MSEATPADDTLEIALDPPIKFKGGEIASLTLQEPTAKQVRDAEKRLDAMFSPPSITEYHMELVRSVSGLSEDAVKLLPVSKLNAAAEFVRNFIDAEPPPSDGDDALMPMLEVTLDPPLTWNKATYTAIQLREPTIEELRKAKSFQRLAITPYTTRCCDMQLLEAVSGLPAAVIHSLPIRKLVEASIILARFTTGGLTIGKR